MGRGSGEMQEELYQQCLIQTTKEIYPKYYRDKLVKLFEQDRLIKLTESLFDEQIEDLVDLTTISEESYFEHCIQNSSKIIKRLEECEFTNTYKYAAIFNMENIPEDKINHLCSRGFIKDFSGEQFVHDVLFAGDNIQNVIPTKYEKDNIIILKFSRHLTGFLPISEDNRRDVKYPILALFYKDLNVLEIRLGQVRGFLKNNDEYFYQKQFEMVLRWIFEKLDCVVEAVNISPVIEHVAEKKQEEVNISGQAMNMRHGAKATLEAGMDDNPVLPLLGQLKDLIKVNEELFDVNDESKEIKNLLENFIFETEATSDLPWISLTWKNESRSKATKVKFQFNYNKQEYTLLQYYYGNKIEMERMNDVTKYLIENKRELEAGSESE
ncbi:hypothetical protein [Bacillus cereus group sp. MG11]|uniref:hypothetical protein n=1 Tax=Bacillus cereus group sp. MG11 TaxID=3040248 RepID=UPI00339113B2